MEKLKVEIVYLEEVLGMASSNPDVYKRFIAARSGDEEKVKEELEAIECSEDLEAPDKTVFPRDDQGRPFQWDYQWKGFCKDACGMLRRADDSKSKGVKAYKKEIDGLVFVAPRKIPFIIPEGEELGECIRPLRASTAKGERVALACSETVPAGSRQTFVITTLRKGLMPCILEWLEYGALRGTGQWRNSGKGKFVYRATDPMGKVVGETFSLVGLED